MMDIPKYPRTPYWPGSPSVAPDDRVSLCPDRFAGPEVVVTEKLDGGNTLLHGGQVYSRSTTSPSRGKWLAMVRKHHAWKLSTDDVFLYGEDIYGVHSIAYGPVAEDATFYAFALRYANNIFASFDAVEEFANERSIPVVPVLFRGRFDGVDEISEFINAAHEDQSILGGEREGIVMRLAQAFHASDFDRSVCKSVRAGHVQTDEHWQKHWVPCAISQIDK